MSNSNEAAEGAVENDNDNNSEPVQQNSEKPTSEESKAAKPARKTARKSAARTGSRKDVSSGEASNEGDQANAGQKSKKEPIQGVRDSRTKKDDADEQRPEVTKQTVEVKEEAPAKSERVQNEEPSRSQSDDDEASQGGNRNRRGRRGRKTTEQAAPPVRQDVCKLDHKDLSAKAWKIFMGEVNEEGLALIGDKDAKELAKRSFRLAELFLEEESRKKPVKAKKNSPSKSPKKESDSKSGE